MSLLLSLFDLHYFEHFSFNPKVPWCLYKFSVNHISPKSLINLVCFSFLFIPHCIPPSPHRAVVLITNKFVSQKPWAMFWQSLSLATLGKTYPPTYSAQRLRNPNYRESTFGGMNLPILVRRVDGVFFFIPPSNSSELTKEEVVRGLQTGYDQSALNCWIAALLYLATLCVSAHQYWANSHVEDQFKVRRRGNDWIMPNNVIMTHDC